MAQYDLVFIKNDSVSGVAWSEYKLQKPPATGYSLTQHPTSGVLSWVQSLNNLGTLSGSFNFNDQQTTGFYVVTPGSTPSNAPRYVNGILQVFKSSDGSIYQTQYCYGGSVTLGDPFTYVRHYNPSTAAWSVWRSNEMGLTTYQLSGIVGTTTGDIYLNNFIGSELGTFNCILEAEFSDLDNGTYRFVAQRTVKFSFTAYQNGINIIHIQPTLVVTAHSGSIVNLSTGVVTNVAEGDISFETATSGLKLVVKAKNNLTSPFTGSIRCRYRLKVTKWNWQSGI